MTMDEAIKANQKHAKEHDLNINQDYFRAINLGIEALKRLKELRLIPRSYPETPLPGETEG